MSDSINALLYQLQTTLSRAGVGSRPTADPDNKPTVGEGDNGDDRPVIE